MSRVSLVKRLTLKVRWELEEASLAQKRFVVAVSGGPDSLALLHLLNDLRSTLGLELHVAHLDHGLRPSSEADAAFVAQEAERLGLKHTLQRVDTRAYRRDKRLSLERAARELRYSFLSSVAQAQGADAVLVGHTSDDQAETVLMHLIRGSGLVGLIGMQKVSEIPYTHHLPVKLVRPLLGLTRKDAEAYCREKGLLPRRDESNQSLKYTRNRLRLKILPLLCHLNPSVTTSIGRLSQVLSPVVQHLEKETERVWPSVASEVSGGIALKRQPLPSLPVAIRYHLLRAAYIRLKGDAQELEQAHLDRMVRLIDGPPGKAIRLPGGLSFRVDYQDVYLLKGEEAPCPLPVLGEGGFIPVPGKTQVGGWRIETQVVDGRYNAKEGKLSACVDWEKVGTHLWVRSRRPGDRFIPLGMSEEKKLQDFMVDTKVPRGWRGQVPLVLSPGGILWVVGWRISEWARVTPGTRSTLRVEFRDKRSESANAVI